MISQHDKTWRPVRLQNLESVKYLNRLFRAGWYLMHIGADGLEYLAFQVPTETPQWTTVNDFPYEFVSMSRESITVLVLHSGTARGRQKARVLKPDLEGRFLIRTVAPKGWKLVMWGIALESGERIAILEREGFQD